MMEQYPNYQQQAMTDLMDEFVTLVNRQEQKPVFDEEGMVTLDTGNISPVQFSTRQIAAIARLLRDMRDDNPKRFDGGSAAVYELAAMAEQRESDDPEHLLHTMMHINHNLPVYRDKDGNPVAAGTLGCLPASIDLKSHALNVSLYDEFSQMPALDWLARMPYTPEGTADTKFYSVTDAILRYTDDDAVLTFLAHPADGKRIKLPADSDNPFEHEAWADETELPAIAMAATSQKEIADWMLESMRRDPSDSWPLYKIGGKWFAPRTSVVEVDGIAVPTAINTFNSANILTVEVGTNGSQGGDSGHGCRTYLRITNDASTDLRCSTGKGAYDTDADGHCLYHMNTEGHDHVDQIEITLGGDCELDTFTSVLRFAADVLEKKENGKLCLVVPRNYKSKE